MGLFNIFKKKAVEPELELEQDVQVQPVQSELSTTEQTIIEPPTQSVYQKICFALRHNLELVRGGTNTVGH